MNYPPNPTQAKEDFVILVTAMTMTFKHGAVQV